MSIEKISFTGKRPSTKFIKKLNAQRNRTLTELFEHGNKDAYSLKHKNNANQTKTPKEFLDKAEKFFSACIGILKGEI